METCKPIDFSDVNEYKRLTKKNKIHWHKCYLARLTRRKAQTKKARNKRDLNVQIKGQRDYIKKLEKK